MFLGVLHTMLFKLSNNPFHFQLRIPFIQIVVITSFVLISNVGMKRVDCICKIFAIFPVPGSTSVTSYLFSHAPRSFENGVTLKGKNFLPF